MALLATAAVLSLTAIVRERTTPAATSAPAFVALPPGPLALAPTAAPALEQAAETPAEGAVFSPSRAESAFFESGRLQREMPYLVYLPPGYDSEPQRRYPVLYMLHGMGGTYSEWYGYGLFEQADRMIREGVITPLLIVLPQGDYSYWVDHAGGPQWGGYVAQDLVSLIDARYRTTPDAAHRAIGGLSMGGHAALQLLYSYPGVFGVVGAHSPTLRGHDDAPSYFGDERAFAAHDPWQLTVAHPEVARAVRIWLDVGERDWWLTPVTTFHDQLTRLAVPHQWSIYPGGHEGSYWTSRIEDYLRFYGTALRDG